MREKKMLTTDLQQAKRNICLLNRKCNSQVMYHKVIPDNNLVVESDDDTATIKDERDIVMKHYEDLSVNSQVVTKELNDIANKHHQTLQHLESFTTRNKCLEENIQKMNMYYSQVCEERNELRRLLSEKRRQLEYQVKSDTSVWLGGDNCVMIKFEETTSHSSQHQCDR
ncbi:uncharacterized protein [Dysidea avara]|uniref:uncharacterized protein n=1 Tax=Dysidea avara TaxID=196820 RepID=UPI0033327CD8